MTQEEKAKAYDEAIERANSLLSGNHLGNAWIYKLLPELKESEDERIRKAVIKFVEGSYSFKAYDGFTKEDCIAWLEKQGEQKPAWSEEDEDILNTIINHFKVDIECTDEDDTVRWLKSLKDRVQPQYITITDEELAQAKKDAYENVLDKIEYDSENPTFDDGWSAAIWYLKKRTAQPQSTWKPSEEQLDALANALSLAKNCGEENAFDLRTLYEQLNKLRKE